MSDIDKVDTMETCMKEALAIVLEEEAILHALVNTHHASLAAAEEAHWKHERDREVWLLRGRLAKLAQLGRKSGWLTRSSLDWYTLLYFSCFASLPSLGMGIEHCPTYPAHRMRKMGDYYLEHPELYHDLLAAFRYQQMMKGVR